MIFINLPNGLYFQRWFRYGKQERRGDKKWSFWDAVWGRRVIRKGAYGSDTSEDFLLKTDDTKSMSKFAQFM